MALERPNLRRQEAEADGTAVPPPPIYLLARGNRRKLCHNGEQASAIIVTYLIDIQRYCIQACQPTHAISHLIDGLDHLSLAAGTPHRGRRGIDGSIHPLRLARANAENLHARATLDDSTRDRSISVRDGFIIAC